MTWHLKDRELEEALNKKSHPNHTFTDRLNEVMAKIPKKDFPVVVGCVVKFQRIGTGGVIHENNVLEFSIEEIENVPKYDPHNWNEYPNVTPPEGIPMRVEIDTLTDEVRRDCAIFKNGRWFSEFGGKANYKIAGPVRRYRPWED